MASASLYAQAPNWTAPEAGQFANQMTVTGAVVFSGNFSRSAQDRVAFFVNDDIRGVGTVTMVPGFGAEAFILGTIFSNVSTGETVEVRVYHASTDQVYVANEIINFQHASALGDFLNPNPFNIGTPPDLPIDLMPIPEQVTLETFPFQLIDLNSFLVSQDNDPVDWSIQPQGGGVEWALIGSILTGIPTEDFTGTATVMVTAREQTPAAQSASGMINYRVAPLVDAPDWTGLGPQTAETGEDFLAIQLNDLVESEECFTLDYAPVFNTNFMEAMPNWVAMGTVQQNMTITTEVQFTPNFTFDHPNDRLAAIINDTIRGVALPTEVNGNRLFFLSIGNYQSTPDTVTILFYSGELEQILEYPVTTLFVPFGENGTPLMPAMLDFSPLLPEIDNYGTLTMTVQDTNWVGVQSFEFIASDCSFPRNLNDRMQVSFCHGSGTNIPDQVFMNQGPFSVCEVRYFELAQLIESINLNGYIYTWSSSGDGNFQDVDGENTNEYPAAHIYRPGPVDVAAKNVTLTLNIAGGVLTGCFGGTSASAEVEVLIVGHGTFPWGG